MANPHTAKQPTRRSELRSGVFVRALLGSRGVWRNADLRVVRLAAASERHRRGLDELLDEVRLRVSLERLQLRAEAPRALQEIVVPRQVLNVVRGVGRPC